ncbi:MAG: DUF2085 domain-containing protein [Oscillospiraceae bacterium]|nr:DUF2085 domain-containing protein [Oscillospiraceae bacterium]
MKLNLVFCHRLPERSFFYKGKQFPVCARCTGVALGRVLALLTFWFWRVGFFAAIAFAAPMLADWLVQRCGIRESTNVRRLVTGILGGYGLTCVALQVVLRIARLL